MYEKILNKSLILATKTLLDLMGSMLALQKLKYNA